MTVLDQIKDMVWDEMALARNLTVQTVKRHDNGGFTYRLSIDIEAPADAQRLLEANANAHECGVIKRLRHYTKFGFKVCFRDDPDDAD